MFGNAVPSGGLPWHDVQLERLSGEPAVWHDVHAGAYAAAQGCSMAKGAGVQHVCRCSVGCCDDQWQCASPRDGVGGVGFMAILAPIGKTADGDVESRVGPRAADRRIGVAPLAVDKVRLGGRAMQRRIGERNGMGSCSIAMAERAVKASRLDACRQRGIGRRRPASQMAEAACIGVCDIGIGMCPCSSLSTARASGAHRRSHRDTPLC